MRAKRRGTFGDEAWHGAALLWATARLRGHDARGGELLAAQRAAGSWPFFVLALGWSWLFWLPVVLSGRSQLAFTGVLLYALGGLGPAVAAIFLVYRTCPPGARRDFWRRVVGTRRIGLVWYAVILLLPLALNALGILTGLLLGAPPPSFERAADLLANPAATIPFVVVVLVFGPLPEELGWRGHSLDRLQEGRSALLASLVLGSVWMLWHWPQFFMQDSYIAGAFFIGSAVSWVGWGSSRRSPTGSSTPEPTSAPGAASSRPSCCTSWSTSWASC